MFQKRIGELFSGMPNVCEIADDFVTAGFDERGKDWDETLEKVLWVCRQTILKLNKDKCLFRCMSIFFGKIISQPAADPSKIQALTDMPQLKMKKELQSFLGILKLSK